MKIYYLDTAIFIDYYENRADKFRPLGDWAHRLLALIRAKGDTLLISDLLIKELEAHLGKANVEKIFEIYEGALRKIEFTQKQADEAKKLARQRKVPFGDALHVIIARDNNALMVTRDAHFESLRDTVNFKKPEELI